LIYVIDCLFISVSMDLGGLDYVLDCLLDSDSSDDIAQWQWSYGRLRTLEYLVGSYESEFSVTSEDSPPTDDTSQVEDTGGCSKLQASAEDQSERGSILSSTNRKQKNFERVFRLFQFAVKYMNFSHAKVRRVTGDLDELPN